MKSFKQGIFALLTAGAIMALGACDVLFTEDSASTSSYTESFASIESTPLASSSIEEASEYNSQNSSEYYIILFSNGC